MKKFIFTLSVILSISLTTFSVCLANNNIVNGNKGNIVPITINSNLPRDEGNKG